MIKNKQYTNIDLYKMSHVSDHASLIVEQIKTHVQYFSHHRNHPIIRSWLTQKGDPLVTLRLVIVQIAALEDPITALNVAEILQTAIARTSLKRINVQEMVHNIWTNEMLA